MGNTCCKTSSRLEKSNSSESIDSNEPLNKDKGHYVIQQRSNGYQNNFVNLGVNGWSGRGVRCDGLDGYCDGYGSDCTGRRKSIHPNLLDGKVREVGAREAGVGVGVGIAAGALGSLREIEEEREGDEGKDKVDVGPRISVKSSEGEEPGNCNQNYDVSGYDH